MPAPRRPRRARRIIEIACFAFVASLVVPMFVAAQGEVTDTDLEGVSGGRTVRIGVTTNGVVRPTDIPLEVYVARVLAGEGEPRAADAAQQALAIAIRTYTMANLGRHQPEGFDICDTTHCQVMRTATPASRRAALATAGQMLTYEGRPAQVFYSASCGGRSEVASAVWPTMRDLPYLKSVEDDVHDDDPEWTAEFTSQQLLEALRKAGLKGTELRNVAVVRHDGSGRVAALRVNGMQPDSVDGAAFRMAVGPNELRSTNFSVRKAGAGYRFTGRGFGHGVGMCVIGAGRRAVRGDTAAQILNLYYPGLKLTSVSTGESTKAGPAGPPPTPVVVLTAPSAVDERGSLQRLAAAAERDLSKVIGTSVAPITVEMHASIDSFRLATGQPWWASAVVSGTSIALAPSAILDQRDGVDATIRVAVAEVLIGNTFNDKPVWMRVGAARYFAHGSGKTRIPDRLQCPQDGELTNAVSATSQRDAEARAEACFARAVQKTNNWRNIR